MKKIKLTTFAKILIVVLSVAILGGVFFATGIFDKAKKDLNSVFKGKSTDEMYAQAGEIVKEEGTINLSLDEWIGWKSIIDANGGLKTQKGSIYDELGLKVNISVINDATQSSNALIKGDLDAAGYTINRYTFLYNKFEENNTPVQMAFVTNSSTGGDGIIAKKDIKKVEDFVGKKIGVPRYSEAQTLVEWLLNQSSLTDKQIADIKANMVMFDTPDDAAKAYFAGELDAAATWEPYLTQAANLSDGHVMFSTKNATNIILDGIVFKKEFIENNRETVSKLLEGANMAAENFDKDTKAIKNTFPMFATEDDEVIREMTKNAQLYNIATNAESLSKNGAAQTLFADMSDIWVGLGEKADRNNASKAFDASIAKELETKFPGEKIQTVSFTEEEKETAKAQDNNDALLTKRLSIKFEPDSTAISTDSFPQLVEFANTAKVLDGVIIQLEGNSPLDEVDFSRRRAESVAKFLQTQGVDPSRFVIVGNGNSKPIADNNTPEGQAANRRTDAYFKVVR